MAAGAGKTVNSLKHKISLIITTGHPFNFALWKKNFETRRLEGKIQKKFFSTIHFVFSYGDPSGGGTSKKVRSNEISTDSTVTVPCKVAWIVPNCANEAVSNLVASKNKEKKKVC